MVVEIHKGACYRSGYLDKLGTMRTKLAYKIFLAFFLTAVLIVALLIGMQYYSIRNFVEYVNLVELDKLESLEARLITIYVRTATGIPCRTIIKSGMTCWKRQGSRWDPRIPRLLKGGALRDRPEAGRPKKTMPGAPAHSDIHLRRLHANHQTLSASGSDWPYSMRTRVWSRAFLGTRWKSSH